MARFLSVDANKLGPPLGWAFPFGKKCKGTPSSSSQLTKQSPSTEMSIEPNLSHEEQLKALVSHPKVTRQLVTFTRDAHGRNVARIIEVDRSNRKKFVAQRISQLNTSLSFCARAFESLREKQLINDQDCLTITAFFGAVVKAVDATLHHNQPCPPSTLKQARTLKPLIDEFKRQTATAIDGGESDHRAISALKHELCDHVAWYCEQIEMTYAIVDVIDGMIYEPNRAINAKQLEIFLLAVWRFRQSKRGQVYPSYTFLKYHGFELSDRTYRNWKKKHREGHYSLRVKNYQSRHEVLDSERRQEVLD